MAETTVLAARLHEHGRPLVLEQTELAQPGNEEVRVELTYGGVNPVDRYVAMGRVAPDGPLPRTLGGEAAGTVDGRRVMVAGEGLGSTRDGLWAQAAVVPTSAVIDLPDGVETPAAAAMGVAGLTAWKVVRELAAVGPDDRVLVLGASGGVGSVIVSLAAAAGATVWGQTGSPGKSALIKRHGADRVAVSGPEELEAAVSELQPTVVFDPLGGGFTPASVQALATRGRLVSFGTSAGPEVRLNMQTVYRKMLAVLGYGGMMLSTEERRAGLEAALSALRDGDLRVAIDTVLPLEDVEEGFRRLEQRRVQGKLLLDLSRSAG